MREYMHRYSRLPKEREGGESRFTSGWRNLIQAMLACNPASSGGASGKRVRKPESMMAPCSLVAVGYFQDVEDARHVFLFGRKESLSKKNPCPLVFVGKS